MFLFYSYCKFYLNFSFFPHYFVLSLLFQVSFLINKFFCTFSIFSLLFQVSFLILRVFFCILSLFLTSFNVLFLISRVFTYFPEISLAFQLPFFTFQFLFFIFSFKSYFLYIFHSLPQVSSPHIHPKLAVTFPLTSSFLLY